MASKANTYRAVLIGLAMIIVAFVAYFIYRAVVGTKKVVQNTPVNAVISPAGSGQSIRENAPISNTPSTNATGHQIVPVTGTGAGSSSNGSSAGTYVTGGGSTSSGSANGGSSSSSGSGSSTGNSSYCIANQPSTDPGCIVQQQYTH